MCVARLCVYGMMCEAIEIQGGSQGSKVLTYAHVCSRMLTYAHVCCCRMLTYADVQGGLAGLQGDDISARRYQRQKHLHVVARQVGHLDALASSRGPRSRRRRRRRRCKRPLRCGTTASSRGEVSCKCTHRHLHALLLPLLQKQSSRRWRGASATRRTRYACPQRAHCQLAAGGASEGRRRELQPRGLARTVAKTFADSF